MYLRFKAIASLDPHFYYNYLWGGMYLSIIKDDMTAAADIFDSGLKYYPNDYELNYRQGFNYYFELGEFEKGLSYLSKIENNPKMPLSIKLIVNKLRFETTLNFDLALNYLYHNIQNEKDPVLQNKLVNDFYALKAERDLNCLNNQKENCDYRDAEGKSYLKTFNGWVAPRKFQPYRIHLPKR
jgi:tetratricopeptide (TPR) repeat protein